MNKTANGAAIFVQCCVCRLPEAPAGVVVSHGYHSQCFREFHRGDYTPEEMAEELSLWEVSIPGDKKGEPKED